MIVSWARYLAVLHVSPCKCVNHRYALCRVAKCVTLLVNTSPLIRPFMPTPVPSHEFAESSTEGGQTVRRSGRLPQSQDSSHSSEAHVTSQRDTAAVDPRSEGRFRRGHTRTFAAYRDLDGSLPSLLIWARTWSADDENRPVTNGQQQ